MKINKQTKRLKAFTLIELSVVLVLVVLIASSLVTMLRQQVQFFSWWKTQKFIAEDAPLVNSMVVRIFSNADVFRIYTDLNAITSVSAGATTGNAMLLGFSQPDGSVEYGAIVFDTTNDSLIYVNLNDTRTAETSRWTIVNDINAAGSGFTVANSIMLLTLQGNFGGEITYAATPAL